MEYSFNYVNEKEFRKKERSIKKYNMFAYKKLLFEYYPSMNEGKFPGVLVSTDEQNRINRYELVLPTDEMFKKVHGNITLHYTVYLKKKEVLLETLTPEDILTEGHQKELTTYKGVMVSKSHKDLDMFKINLLNSMNKNGFFEYSNYSSSNSVNRSLTNDIVTSKKEKVDNLSKDSKNSNDSYIVKEEKNNKKEDIIIIKPEFKKEKNINISKDNLFELESNINLENDIYNYLFEIRKKLLEIEKIKYIKELINTYRKNILANSKLENIKNKKQIKCSIDDIKKEMVKPEFINNEKTVEENDTSLTIKTISIITTIFYFLMCAATDFDSFAIKLFLIAWILSIVIFSIIIKNDAKTKYLKELEKVRKKDKEEYKRKLELFEKKAREEYNDILEENEKIIEYNNKVKELNKEIKVKNKFYLENSEIINTEFLKINDLLEMNIESLEKELIDFYEDNTIFEKYKTLEYISIFMEYFENERVLTFKGKDGAYSLLESEINNESKKYYYVLENKKYINNYKKIIKYYLVNIYNSYIDLNKQNIDKNIEEIKRILKMYKEK